MKGSARKVGRTAKVTPGTDTPSKPPVKIDIKIEEPSDSSSSPVKTPPDLYSVDGDDTTLPDDVLAAIARVDNVNDDVTSIRSEDGGTSLGDRDSKVSVLLEPVSENKGNNENKHIKEQGDNTDVQEENDDTKQATVNAVDPVPALIDETESKDSLGIFKPMTKLKVITCFMYRHFGDNCNYLQVNIFL